MHLDTQPRLFELDGAVIAMDPAHRVRPQKIVEGGTCAHLSLRIRNRGRTGPALGLRPQWGGEVARRLKLVGEVGIVRRHIDVIE
jgi:hypothetical protein